MLERYKYASKKTYGIGMKHKMNIAQFVDDFVKKNGYSPLQSEICKAVGLSSSHINRYFWELVDKGILVVDCTSRARRNVRVAENWKDSFLAAESEVV